MNLAGGDHENPVLRVPGVRRRRGCGRSVFTLGAEHLPSVVKELVATWQRAATEIIDVAEAMPEEKYGYKPTPEVATFRDQLVHLAGITQRFIDSAKGTKS